MREILAFSVVAIYIVSGSIYIRLVRRGKIKPVLATWLLFSLATFLNALSFAKATEFDWVSGSLGIADAAYCSSIAFTVMKHRTGKIILEKFERYYLGSAIGVIGFWIATGSAFGTNVLAQILIFIGYFPTAHSLVKTKINSEPFSVWFCALIAGFIGLWVAISGKQALAIIYATRTVVSVPLLIALMYKYRPKPSNLKSLLREEVI